MKLHIAFKHVSPFRFFTFFLEEYGHSSPVEGEHWYLLSDQVNIALNS